LKSEKNETLKSDETDDYERIMAEAKEMLKDHKENKINFNTGSTLFSNFNDSQITDGSYVDTPTKASKMLNDSTMLDKTIENGNMSFTNVDYGGINTDMTKMNDSRMSLTQNDFGKIQPKLDDSRMSFTNNDFGMINETLNESRMSVTNSDYGKIQSKLEESKLETRMSLTKNDFGKIYENLSKLNVPSSRKSLPQNNFQKFKKNISRLSLINPKLNSEMDFKTPQEEDLNKTQMNESRMSLTQNDFGKLESRMSLSKINETFNESRMSIANSDYGNIKSKLDESKLDESKMSLTKNDFGNISESSSDQSVDLEKSKLNESRMSLTRNDFGNISEQKEEKDDSLMFLDSEQNSEESIDMGKKMSLTRSDYGMINEEKLEESMDMGRMSITQSDYGKIHENKSRKSLSLNDQTNLEESRMSLTKNDFGNNLESSSDEDLEESRMSLTVSDFGKIQSKLNESRNSISKGDSSISKGDSRMSLSKNDKSRMSLTIEDFGKIHLVDHKSDESIDLDRMSMTKNDFGAITKVEEDSDDTIDTIEDSVDFDRMSLTKNDYGKLGENNETWDANLFADSDEEKELNQEKEDIDGVEDILSEMRDHSMTLDFSKDLKGSTIFDEPTASELLGVNDFEDKKIEESVDSKNKATQGSPKTVTLQNVKSKFQSIKTPNESIDFSQRSVNRSHFQNESIDFSQRSGNRTMTITSTPSQKLIQSVKNLSTTKKSAKRNLSANIESVANYSNKSDTTFELLSASLRMTPQKRINEIRKNYISEKTETTQEFLKFNPITVSDFFNRSNVRFLDDLTNQRRPKSPIDLKTMDASNNAGKLQVVSFIAQEIPILESACNKMLSNCEQFRKEVTNLEESYNLKNPYVFQHIQRIQADELSNFCVRFTFS
jgi:hypothetical protein